MYLTDAVVWTGNPLRPWAEALWCKDGSIRAVGSNAEVAGAVPEGLSPVSCGSAFISPGLVDAHAHFLGFALGLDRVDLVGCASLEETLDRIAAAARLMDAREETGWLQGRGWDQNDWPEMKFPTAADLDAVTGGRPAAFERIDGHAVWVNTAGLAAAGVTQDTPDPPGGRLVRDAQGRPSGVLIDQAERMIQQVIPEPDARSRANALRRAAPVLSAAGLTAIHDMGMTAEELDVYRDLASSEDLGLRVYAAFSASDFALAEVLERGPDRDWQGGWFKLGMIKFYLDGALGSRGAALLEPYSDDPGNRGLLVTDPDQFNRQLPQVLASGFQAAVHAIGDHGNRIALDAWEAARERAGDIEVPRPAPSLLGNPLSEHPRLRIEHAQVIELSDLDRFAQLGVIASMQPTHCTSDMPWAPSRLGESRLLGAYAWRSLRQRGVLLAAGSDFPVESHDPLLGIYAAVTRRPPGGGHPGWSPGERLAREEALAAFTAAPAYASGDLHQLGTLAPGMSADFVLWDRNLVTCDIERLLDAKVLKTIVNGRMVYQQPGMGGNRRE